MKFSAVLYALEHGRIAEWEGENFRLREGHLETDRHGIWQTCAIPRHGATSSTWKISPAWQSGPTEPPKCGDPCFVVGCREACDKPPGTRESNHGDIHGHGLHAWRFDYHQTNTPKPCGSVAPSCDWVDELAERRQRLGTPGRFRWETAQDDQAHPNCRCVPLPLPDITLPRPSLWQRFKNWRSRRRAERTIRGLYADLRRPE